MNRNLTSGDEFTRLCAILQFEYLKAEGTRNWSTLTTVSAMLCRSYPTAAPKLAHDLCDAHSSLHTT